MAEIRSRPETTGLLLSLNRRESSSSFSRSISYENERKHFMRCSQYFRNCCVPFKAVILVLIWSVLLHLSQFVLYVPISSELSTRSGTFAFNRITVIALESSMIVTFLLYPLAGLLAETLFTRLKFMIAASVITMIGLILIITTSIMDISHWYSGYKVILSLEIIGLIFHQLGVGMFEANVIQFGVDQLQFSSNEELSKFVHWYYLSVNVAQFLVLLYVIGYKAPYFVKNNYSPYYYFSSDQYVILVISTLSFLCIIVALGLVFYCNYCSYLLIEPTSSSNPVTLIYKVMNYARHHSQPVKRSAFTYGEPPPSRLDIAKERYGGPFTTEQVEDVKSFWKILSLLLTLFGLSLSANLVLMYLGLTQATVVTEGSGILDKFYSGVAVVTYNQNIYYPFVILSIPVYMCIIRPCLSNWRYCLRLRISMLKKMGCGLVMICITMTLAAASSTIMYEGYDGNQCIIENISSDYRDLNLTSTAKGFAFLTLPIAQVFQAVGRILIFLTALEFILAQAPRTMQGLLIGLWYAYQSFGIAVFLIITLTEDVMNCPYWPYIILTVLSFVSLCLYIVLSYRYTYRQRQESTNINFQTIIEDYTSRHLQQAHEQAKRREMETSVDVIIIDD